MGYYRQQMERLREDIAALSERETRIQQWRIDDDVRRVSKTVAAAAEAEESGENDGGMCSSAAAGAVDSGDPLRDSELWSLQM